MTIIETFLQFSKNSLLVLTLLLSYAAVINAQVAYDPYADAVNSSSGSVLNPNNTLGAPDNSSATILSGASITLDMGVHEEGLQSLRLYLGQVTVQTELVVQFLDSNQGVIKSETLPLAINPNPSTVTAPYNWTSFAKAYRYVRLTSQAVIINLDAIEALGYIGATASQDTDSDGRSDRSEHAAGTNPLVADNPSSPGGGATPSSPSSSITTNTSTSKQTESNAQTRDGVESPGDTQSSPHPERGSNSLTEFFPPFPWMLVLGLGLLLVLLLLLWLAHQQHLLLDPPTFESSTWYRFRYNLYKKIARFTEKLNRPFLGAQP